MEAEFKEMGKIYRLFREIEITEKIDGTNAQIHIDSDGTIRAGSRNRYITPEDDNAGFAKWVMENKEVLIDRLGHGRHYGEWWGSGIQRRYNQTEKHFSLFRTDRNEDTASIANCVPVLYRGAFSQDAVFQCLTRLKAIGSVAAPGFMRPEGVVIRFIDSRILFKITLDGDGHKGAKP